MPRTPRLLRSDEPSVYHVISRTALEGFPLGDVEKDFMLELIRRYAAFYFVEILGFCLMGNHFHLMVRVFPESEFTDEDIRKRYEKEKGDRYFMLDTFPPLKLYGREAGMFPTKEG